MEPGLSLPGSEREVWPQRVPPPRDTLDTLHPAMPIPAGQPAPNLSVSAWVQGAATNLDRQRGNVVLMEVFQVNCPGCFFSAIPEAIRVHNRFAGQPVTVLGIATAFEDWDKNTFDNLQRLAETGEVIGETRRMLDRAGLLDDGRLRYRIPFPLAMDELVAVAGDPTREQAVAAIRPQVPVFDTLPRSAQEPVDRPGDNVPEVPRVRANDVRSVRAAGHAVDHRRRQAGYASGDHLRPGRRTRPPRSRPSSTSDFVRTPAPGAERRNYGGLFWLNRGGTLPEAPEDTYWRTGRSAPWTVHGHRPVPRSRGRPAGTEPRRPRGVPVPDHRPVGRGHRPLSRFTPPQARV